MIMIMSYLCSPFFFILRVFIYALSVFSSFTLTALPLSWRFPVTSLCALLIMFFLRSPLHNVSVMAFPVSSSFSFTSAPLLIIPQQQVCLINDKAQPSVISPTFTHSDFPFPFLLCIHRCVSSYPHSQRSFGIFPFSGSYAATSLSLILRLFTFPLSYESRFLCLFSPLPHVQPSVLLHLSLLRHFSQRVTSTIQPPTPSPSPHLPCT